MSEQIRIVVSRVNEAADAIRAIADATENRGIGGGYEGVGCSTGEALNYLLRQCEACGKSLAEQMRQSAEDLASIAVDFQDTDAGLSKIWSAK